jgi:hypothetical protein
MPRPLWVKPSRLGSSVGISRVLSPEGELDDAIELAAAHDPRVIVEADAGGREVECSVIGNTALGPASRVEVSIPGEIVAKASEWYDYEAKYDEGGMELLVPAPIGDDGVARVRELAEIVFTAIAGTASFFVRDDGSAGQRDQRSRLHRDERVRQALRGERHPYRALRPSGGPGGRTPPRAATSTNGVDPLRGTDRGYGTPGGSKGVCMGAVRVGSVSPSRPRRLARGGSCLRSRRSWWPWQRGA